ncbi:hypothetical protein MTR_0055s0060 [Medicago truncatula]|uniref:Uncharacterized protein n=1 Tax=Medicago truncatula TaxID=3880 RepID=A0A072THH0_MEDTR|nr:hypothetical protein MTR_0055s0060 [Medicago truncatula]
MSTHPRDESCPPKIVRTSSEKFWKICTRDSLIANILSVISRRNEKANPRLAPELQNATLPWLGLAWAGEGAREEFPPPDVVWPEHVLPARFGLPQKFRQRGRALEIFAYESPPDVIWPVPRGDFCPRIPSRRDLACGCPGQERQDFPHFPTKSPPNSSKDPNLSKKFDENGADLGGAACWGVPSHAPAMPQQGAPPIYA